MILLTTPLQGFPESARRFWSKRDWLKATAPGISHKREVADIEKKVKQDSLTEQEQKLLELIKNLDYGEMRIVVKEGVPVHIEEIKKSIKL